MCRERHTLFAEIDRAAKTDAAALERKLLLPFAGNFHHLFEHPITCAGAIGRPRLSPDQFVAFEQLYRKLRAADIHGQRSHAPAASKTSAGEAVPVPFFMMVMDATRLPNRTASTG